MTMGDVLSWLSGFSQHTLVATLRLLAPEAGEGWLRLPFKPLNRLSADQADSLHRILTHWFLRVLEKDSFVGNSISCG